MKTIKNLIWMAALTLTAATWSACSNDDEPTAAEQPAQSRTYTVTTTLSPRNGGTRSTMTDNGDGSISAEWKVGDKIWVSYFSGADPKETTAEVIAVSDGNDGKDKGTATIRVTLTAPNNYGNIYFGYPYSYYAKTKNPNTDQTGTLADINANFAAIEASGVMYVSDSDVTLSIGSIQPQMCIWKFTFTNGTSNITSDITKLVIDLPDPDPNSHKTYTVSPSSQSPIYVAMYGSGFSTPKSISITAKTSTGVYRKVAASVTLAAGKTYTTTGLALTSPAVENAVAGDIGSVIGADGNIYPNANIATTFGTTARAMIAYVGSASDCAHGLALQLNSSPAEGNWADAKSYAEGLTAVSGGTWRLPSKADWQNMFLACAKSGDASSASDKMEPIAGFKEKIIATGTTWQTSKYYWSSTKVSESSTNAWDVSVNLVGSPSSAKFYEGNTTTLYHYVLGCLAF